MTTKDTTTKPKPTINAKIRHAINAIAKIDQKLYTTDCLRFMANNSLTYQYDVKLFSVLVTLDEMKEFMKAHKIKNDRDLHKYMRRQLIEYVTEVVAKRK